MTRSQTEVLLVDGRSVDAPTQRTREALKHLVSIGLITLSWESIFRCVDPRDEADLLHAIDRSCPELLPFPVSRSRADPFLEEDQRPVCCPSCNRRHWPRRHQRTVLKRVRVQLERSQVGEYLHRVLEDAVRGVHTLKAGAVWRFMHNDAELVVVLLDAARATRFAQPRWAEAQPTLYVVVDADRLFGQLGSAPWLHRLALHELVDGGRSALMDHLDALSDGAPLLAEPAPPPWIPALRQSSRQSARLLGLHGLSVGEVSADLDGVIVVPMGATGQLEALRFLAERCSEDVRDGKTAEAHCFYDSDEVLEDLEERGVAQTRDPATVRRQLNRLRRAIGDRYREATGLALDAGEIIERGAEGYRLNGARVSVMR